MSGPGFREAERKHSGRLLDMMRELYAHDGIPFDEIKSRKAMDELIASMDSAVVDYGRIWFIESEGEVAGYLVLTFGFSLEYGGMHGFIDELFVREPFRGRGFGTAAIEHAAELCHHLRMSALLLEVDLENPEAHALYARLGFTENRRRLMTKQLAD